MTFSLLLHDDSMILLWSETILVWTLVSYSQPDPRRGDGSRRFRGKWIMALGLRAALAAGMVCVASRTLQSLWLAAFIALAAAVVPLLRATVPARFLAEFELLITMAVPVISLELISTLHLRTGGGLLLSDRHTAAIFIVSAVIVWVIHGGTYVVRGILDKSGALPKVPASPTADGGQIDTTEYNRGRLIGALERLLLLAIVATGNYQALAFIVAAKGLIRAKELEHRDWAEYFLVGTLTSVLVAIGAGLAIQLTLKHLW